MLKMIDADYHHVAKQYSTTTVDYFVTRSFMLHASCVIHSHPRHYSTSYSGKVILYGVDWSLEL
jgi:hypothetical protein